jgi:hypothetical protein
MRPADAHGCGILVVSVVVHTGFFAIEPIPARSGFAGLRCNISRRGWSERLLWIVLAVRLTETKIMLSVLVQVLGRNPVAA